MSFDDLMYLIDPFRRLADIFRDLRRLADEAPCSVNMPEQRITEIYLPSCSGEFPQDIK